MSQRPSVRPRGVVYTCLFGFSEEFADHRYKYEDVDFVCFTDDPELRSEFWDIRHVRPSLLDPVRAAKRIKHLPHRYLADYDWSLYIDNTILLKKTPEEIYDQFLQQARSPLVCFHHDSRDCVYAEAEAVLEFSYDEPYRVRRQMEFYQGLGYPRANGLFLSGFLLRRHHDPVLVEIMEQWHEQMFVHSLRDQLSLPVVLHYNQFVPDVIERDFLDVVEWPVLRGARLPRDFDEVHYLQINPDLQCDPDVSSNARKHYLHHGRSEGRPYKSEDARRYGDPHALREKLAQSDKEIDELRTALGQREATIAVLNQALAEVADLQESIAASDAQIEAMHDQLARHEAHSAALDQALSERNSDVAVAGAELCGRAARINTLEAVISALRHSTCWRITSPLRQSKHVSIALIQAISSQRETFSRWAAGARTQSPSVALRQQTKIPEVEILSKNLKENIEDVVVESRDPVAEYVPRLEAQPLADKAARLICFYLPQFHVIPENDAWWGKGFTEWTNVRAAEPQFDGHYQPHEPGDLGYYDLLDKSVQGKQIELAKTYGIEGFCFYFYWFSGKRLLETPIQNYVVDKSLDLPFCLCWANENWTRRWDGLDSDILIGQQHSPEDDVAFIAHVAGYMRDPRYIRVNGKPLLLVYRPALLPDAKGTARRWRRWCREHDLGEIYLAYTQSFEAVAPDIYGFDAAVEFPPNNSSPFDVTDTVRPNHDRFDSSVYDWKTFLTRSRCYEDPGYRLFRGVCPGWDNTARRKSNGIVFVNNTPAHFGEWLRNAIADTKRRFARPDERLIFINAWNEWAEGAHLEPDVRHGYAFLEATRVALARKAAEPSRAAKPLTSQRRAAIVMHAFYPDILAEILKFVCALPGRHKLFVTTTACNEDVIRKHLKETDRPFSLFVVENRGRDVLPFLTTYPSVRAEGFDYLAKIHTKKSPHRVDGEVWRRGLIGKLLDPVGFENALKDLERNTDIGMIGPGNYCYSIRDFEGSNTHKLFKIAQRLGLPDGDVLDQRFFAGTMFISKTAAMEPLLSLAFRPNDFEDETDQIDGTLAHAIERAFGLSVCASGQQLALIPETGSHQAVRVSNFAAGISPSRVF